jgi:HlyD family secretion protein
LREDLVKNLKVGDRFDVRIPALERPPHHRRGQAHRHQGRIRELARHPRHRRFRPADILASAPIPVEKVPELRPGMSAYMEWQQRR